MIDRIPSSSWLPHLSLMPLLAECATLVTRVLALAPSQLLGPFGGSKIGLLSVGAVGRPVGARVLTVSQGGKAQSLSLRRRRPLAPALRSLPMITLSDLREVYVATVFFMRGIMLWVMLLDEEICSVNDTANCLSAAVVGLPVGAFSGGLSASRLAPLSWGCWSPRWSLCVYYIARWKGTVVAASRPCLGTRKLAPSGAR